MNLLTPVGKHLMDCLQIKPGLKVLDIGTGPGEPALTLARMVAPSGHVTGVDLSERMIEIAQ